MTGGIIIHTPPNEILEKIFLKVPMKLLMTLRRVCKDWKTLIENPEFARCYFRAISNTYNILVVILSNEKIFTLDIKNSGLEADYIIANHDFENVHGVGLFKLIGSCINLLCFLTKEGSLLLYSPMNNREWLVPFFRNTQSISVIKQYVGFGYDSKSYDYKIVRIVWFSSETSCGVDCQVNVYCLKSNSWRTMEYVNNYKPKSETTQGVFVENALHWMVLGDFPNPSTQLLSFDIVSEEFSLLGPPDLQENYSLTSMTLHALGGLLSLYAFESYQTDIWVMKIYGVQESWTKMFSINTDANQMKPIAFSEDKSKVLMCSLNGGLYHLYPPCARFCWYDGNKRLHETILFNSAEKPRFKAESCLVCNIVD